FDTDRNRTQVRYSDDGSFAGMKSSIRLETGFLGKLNISISAAPYTKSRYAVVTPFDPKQGYPVDTDDLSFHRRVVKISKMRHELADAIEGLYLFVFITDEDLSLNGRMQALLQENATLTGSDIASMLHHLFLTLKFPNGSSVTARAMYDTHQRLLLLDRKSTRLNSSHLVISYAVFCLKKKTKIARDFLSRSLTRLHDPFSTPRSS